MSLFHLFLLLTISFEFAVANQPGFFSNQCPPGQVSRVTYPLTCNRQEQQRGDPNHPESGPAFCQVRPVRHCITQRNLLHQPAAASNLQQQQQQQASKLPVNAQAEPERPIHLSAFSPSAPADGFDSLGQLRKQEASLKSNVRTNDGLDVPKLQNMHFQNAPNVQNIPNPQTNFPGVPNSQANFPSVPNPQANFPSVPHTPKPQTANFPNVPHTPKPSTANFPSVPHTPKLQTTNFPNANRFTSFNNNNNNNNNNKESSDQNRNKPFFSFTVLSVDKNFVQFNDPNDQLFEITVL